MLPNKYIPIEERYNNFKIDDEISLSTNQMAYPNDFLISKVSEKAIQLKNSKNQSTWLPKTAIDWSDVNNCYHLKNWFRKSMKLDKILILQS